MNRLKTFLLFVWVTIWIFPIKGQLLLHSPEWLFEKFPVFNESYIKQRQIKSITFDIIDKKDWQEPDDKDLTEVYEFDKEGRILRKYHTGVNKIIRYETHNKKGKNIVINEHIEYDTISTEYVYQPNVLIERNIYPNNYIEATYFKKCGKWICKEEKYIETYRQLSTGGKVLDKLLLKAQDSIATYDFGKQIKQVYFNNEKLPYKEKFIYLNDQKQIVEITEQLVVANGKIKKVFDYNSAGQLEDAVMVVDYGIPETYSIHLYYDKQGRVESEKQFKNNKELKEYQYIYSENNQELKSILIRHFDESSIRIIKLKMGYY